MNRESQDGLREEEGSMEKGREGGLGASKLVTGQGENQCEREPGGLQV